MGGAFPINGIMSWRGGSSRIMSATASGGGGNSELWDYHYLIICALNECELG